MIAFLFRTYDAATAFVADARAFAWVLALSLKSRYRR